VRLYQVAAATHLESTAKLLLHFLVPPALDCPLVRNLIVRLRKNTKFCAFVRSHDLVRRNEYVPERSNEF
jgi:hypothetical protein